MKKNIFIIALIFNCIIINYQLIAQPTIQWEKSYGSSWLEFARSVQQTSDYGFIMVGASQFADNDVSVNYGSNDYWVVKTDSLGNIEWEKSYGGSESDYALSVQQTTDGGYVVIGNSKSNDVDVSGHHGSVSANDIWLIKLDALGNLLWEKSYGGISEETASYIQQTTDGGYIFTGSSSVVDGDVTTFNGGMSDYWVVKIDGLGNILWQKSYGGNGTDEANSVQQTQNGGYVVAGVSSSSNGDISNPKGSNDYWVIMLDSIGGILWEKSYGGSGADLAKSIRQTNDGGFVIVGESLSSDGDVTVNPTSLWLIKIDNNAGLLWQRGFSVGISWQAKDVIEISSDGGFLIASGVNANFNDISVIKTDSLGNLDWQKQLGGSGSDEPVAFREITGGRYVVFAVSDSFDGDINNPVGADDYWLVKLDAVVGVNKTNLPKKDVIIYPNPTQGIFQIITKGLIHQFTIINSIGKVVMQQQLNQESVSIDIGNYPKGFYVVKLKMENETIINKIIHTQ